MARRGRAETEDPRPRLRTNKPRAAPPCPPASKPSPAPIPSTPSRSPTGSGGIEKLKNLDCGIYLLGRDDTDIRRLSELNRTLREITETMLLYRDFRDIATRLFAVVRRSLPVASIDYYAALPEGGVLSLKAESRFAGVVEDQLPYACTFVGRNRTEWESTHAEDPAMADHRLHPEGFCTQPTGSGGLEITLPLRRPRAEGIPRRAAPSRRHGAVRGQGRRARPLLHGRRDRRAHPDRRPDRPDRRLSRLRAPGRPRFSAAPAP